MKKLVLTTLTVAFGAVLAHAQGIIQLQDQAAGIVVTNGSSIGEGTGGTAGTSQYYFEVLDMTSTAYAGLTGQQQAGIYSLLSNPSDLSLWTDAGLSGVNYSINHGGVNGQGAGNGAAAANWAAPTGVSYNTAPSYDYYTVVGWSANEGTTWAAVSAEITDGNWAVTGVGSWFGQSQTAYNYAGGGPNTLAQVQILAASSTGLAGSGPQGANPQIVLTPIVTPEPTTLALAGLGGLSMLFLRRRKA